MIAHLRMGGCRQSGQMWCWVHACGVLGAGGTPTTMRAVSTIGNPMSSCHTLVSCVLHIVDQVHSHLM